MVISMYEAQVYQHKILYRTEHVKGTQKLNFLESFCNAWHRNMGAWLLTRG